MSTEPRMTLAGEAHGSEEAASTVQASTRTVTPPPIPTKVEALQGGVVALIGLVTDMQDRLAKLEAERSTPHAIDHAIEEAVSGIDWEGHAADALAECDASSYAQDAIEQASIDIDLSGQAEEAVDDAVTSGYVESAIETAVERIDVKKLVQDMLSNYRLDLVENID